MMDGKRNINNKPILFPSMLLVLVNAAMSFLVHYQFNVLIEFLLVMLVTAFLFATSSHYFGKCLSFAFPKKRDLAINIMLAIIVYGIFYLVLNTGNYGKIPNVQDYDISLSIIAFSCIIGPVIEEIIFRGLLTRVFKSDILSLIFSSLLFAVMHGNLSPVVITLYSLFALVAFYRYQKTNNLVNAIVFHSTFSLISIFLVFI